MASSSPHEQFLEELKAARLSRKLTQAEVASRIKISRAQYTAIENGRSMINFVHLYNLAVALEVQWLIGSLSGETNS